MSTWQKDTDQIEPGQSYTHRQYPPGTLVVVAKAAQDLFADILPCAGQQAEATTGFYWPQQDAAFGIRREEMVPVRYQRRIYDIPERFVTLVQASGAPCETAEEKRTGQSPAPSECDSMPGGAAQRGSQVARLRQQIQREYEAAQQGLSGLACGTARHDFITAREHNLHQYHQQLIALVGPQEATSLLVQAIWTPEDMGKDANAQLL